MWVHWKQELSKPAPFTEPYRVTEAGALLFSLPSLPRSLLIDALPEPVTNGALFIFKKERVPPIASGFLSGIICLLGLSLCTVFTLQYKQPPDDCCYELVLRKKHNRPSQLSYFSLHFIGDQAHSCYCERFCQRKKENKISDKRNCLWLRGSRSAVGL